ncbi:unnamed protein product, partial [Prunus brigantina]
DTLKPGDTLNSFSSLVSASAKFTLSFFGPNESYLTIMRNKYPTNEAWIGNWRTPIRQPLSAILTLDRNNTLKITQNGEDPIVICSPQTSNITTSVVVATLLDYGDFVLQ